MTRQMPYLKMSEYQPRLPSNNAYDYYISAARQLKSVVYIGVQPPTREEVRWIESNQRAFTTLQQGYTRAYQWPFSETGVDFRFDEFAALRNLARLVNTRIRWAIAAKDGMDAVHDWHIGFKMARDIQGDLLLPYLVGVAIEAVIHAPIIREIDFFSAHECRVLAHTLIKSERTHDRIGTVIEGELALALRTLDQFLPVGGPDTASFSELIGVPYRLLGDEGPDPETQQMMEHLKREVQQLLRQPVAYQRLRRDLYREISRNWQAVADALTLPGGRYQPLQEKEYDMNTLFGYLATLFKPLSQIVLKYWHMRTHRRLMIVHLLLREYRLREGHYPTSLEELNLKELAIDPFSGRPFIYRLLGERYQLYSVGEDGKDDGGHNPNRKENPDAEIPRDLFLTRDSWR